MEDDCYVSPAKKDRCEEGIKKAQSENREDIIDRFLNADNTEIKDTDDEEEIINMLKEKR